MVVRAGQSFFQTAGEEGPHLWFVLADPDPVTDQVVMVMMVTTRRHTDRTVQLVAGDHDSIAHDSSLDYGCSKLIKAERLLAEVSSGVWRRKADMSPELLQRVREGLLASPRTINYMKNHCRSRF